MKKKDIPNLLCCFRILLIPFVLFFLLDSAWSDGIFYPVRIFLSAFLFSVASVTDLLDGKIARKYNYVTNLGKFLDPIADKMLTLSLFVAFTDIENSLLVTVSSILILLRELTISGLRLSAAGHQVVVAANMWGKIKTTLQMCCILFTYAVLFTRYFLPGWTFLTLISHLLIALVAVYTWISAVPYIKATAPYLKG